MNQALKGITIPVTTPFDPAENVDVEALEHNFDMWNRTDVRGYMVLGTNGEFRLLDDSDSRTVVATAAAHAADKTLIVGVGRESTKHTIDVIHSLEPWYDRIDYVSVLTPHYFPKLMTARALTQYYTAVADASPLPVLLYVIPGSANGVVVPPTVLSRLADHPSIAGVKDTSPALMTSYMLAAGQRDDFSVMAGSLGNIITNLTFGGPGGVVSAANYLPAECARLISLHDSDPAAARRYYALLQKVASATGAKNSVVSVKAMMNARGFRAGAPRHPLQPMADDTVYDLARTLHEGIEALNAFKD